MKAVTIMLAQPLANEAELQQTLHQSAEAEVSAPRSLMEHFRELRRRLLYCFIAVAIAFVMIVSTCAGALVEFISAPVKSRGVEFIYIGLPEMFTAELAVSFIAAIVVASPAVFYHAWRFIQPALYENERKNVLLFMASSVGLFLLGIVFGYKVVFMAAISFFVYTGAGIATPMISIHQYVGFLFTFVLSFGLVFEMPIVIYTLCRMGITTPEQLTALRKYIVLAIFLIAAFLTPPDVLSQVLMACPMILLYETGIVVAKLTCGKREAAERCGGQ